MPEITVKVDSGTTTIQTPGFFYENLKPIKELLKQVFFYEENAQAIEDLRSELLKYKAVCDEDAKLARIIMDDDQKAKGMSRRVCFRSIEDAKHIKAVWRAFEYADKHKSL